jgi:hypothetical protein
MPKKTKREMSAEDFQALSDAEKEKIWREIDAQSPQESLRQSRPLNSKEKRQWRKLKRKLGRPMIGKGTTNISVSMERELLKKADSFARAHGLSRSELIASGVRAVIGSAA